MIVETFPVGLLQCNCTIIGCPRTKQALVVDPGGDVDRILAVCAERGLTVTRIAHTHAHFDHVGGTAELQAKTGAEVLLHPDDLWLYDDLDGQCAMVGMPPLGLGTCPPLDAELEDRQDLTVGELASHVLHTPGHTPGSVCFSLQTPDGMLLLAGDTLFRGSIGRTDFPRGDFDQIQGSIRDRLLVLDQDTRVITGHGPETTIGWERQHNPFVQN